MSRLTRQELRDLIAFLRSLLARPVPPKPKPSPFSPLFGIDYAWGNPKIGQMRGAGISFVCRYLSTPPNSKNLRRLELKALRHAGVSLVTVWETSAQRALDGKGAGEADAREAGDLLRQLGAPGTAVVYFAADWDEAPAQQLALDGYFAGAGHVLGVQRVGGYGGYWPLKRLLDAKLITWAWQTYAWSGGLWEPRAHLRQFSNGHQLAGVECDFDRAMAPAYGQWR